MNASIDLESAEQVVDLLRSKKTNRGYAIELLEAFAWQHLTQRRRESELQKRLEAWQQKMRKDAMKKPAKSRKRTTDIELLRKAAKPQPKGVKLPRAKVVVRRGFSRS